MSSKTPTDTAKPAAFDDHWASEAAWERYQERLGNKTGDEEAAIRRAFMTGWSERGKLA